MSATILSGDITIYYLDEGRQKRLEWTGAATTTYTANELYSACADLFDESNQMDDGSVMSAETPTEYTLGKIDAGDLDPWYISYDCMEHIKGGAIKTSGWTRDLPGDGTGNTGIVVVACTSSTIDSSDIGDGIQNTTNGDQGTLLDVIEGGATDYLVIRPDSNALANDWDSTSGTIDMDSSANSATQSAAGVTGEQIWANFYTVTPIEADTHVYLYQGTVDDESRTRIYNIAATSPSQDWWGEGALDRCIFIKDFKTADAPIIDGGYVTAFVRKGNTLYDSFELQASNTSGGRNPIPLSASNDLNQTTGYQSITFTAASGNWSVGDEMQGDTSKARAIITQIDNPGATQTVHYYLIHANDTTLQGNPLITFNTTAENLTNNDDTGTGTKNGSAPADQGPALATWFTNNTFPVITHGNTTYDIDNDGTAEGYGITIDCNQNPLSEVYEWLKYKTRNGETSTTSSQDGLEGEQYEGATVYLAYSGTVSGGTIDEQEDVVQANTGATGVVLSHDTTLKQILLRNTRGTFNTSDTVTSQDAGAGTVTPNTAATTFTPTKASPFGTFAGGTFFGSRGVLLSDWINSGPTSDENSFQLTDSSGTVRTRPQAYSITVTNLTQNGAETSTTSDRVAVFRLASEGGAIDKTEYSAYGGEAIAATTLDVDTALSTDTPGKTDGGVLRIRDADNSNKEYRLRFSSWANDGGGGSDGSFTLASVTPSNLTAGTNSTTVVSSTDELDGLKRGDLILNETRSNAVSYVTSVDASTNTVTIFPAIGSQASTDTISFNTCPVAINTADDVFVSLIDKHADASTASVSLITGGTPIYYRVVVRNVAATTKIKPFTTDDAISSANRSVATIRTTDTIYS